ncbi:hypothetical protein JX266_003093 [Neoarthrinium moseri]|nr:hypothetical protein JX266_003093 [Neoarthrinium moseri]
MDDDPVCVVGIACHLPGGIRSPSDLWEFLIHKRSAQSRVPASRFNIKGFYHPDGSRAGVMNADGGYFLQEDVRLFENGFFGINSMETAYMDPQQRKLLEVVFECFENAGVSLEEISGTNTGVYVGNFTVDHQTIQARDPDTIHRYNATGGSTTILANRISHVFDLQGPSSTTDTACSSSLYCLDSAVNSLKRGDCDGAVVAAVNLITSPEQCLATMKAGVLSPTSTCHTFDASADGYGRADGVNAIYLKRLSSAMRDRNKIWALIRATAVNACGRTPGITQPSANLQEAVIRKAYSNSGLSFTDTDYIECHGTGTPVGDPIEVEAISRCFSLSRESPLLIGAVKTNLGHSEAASGLTSIIKVALAFEHGANAHAILEAFDVSMILDQPLGHEAQVANSGRRLVLPVSAATNKALDDRARQISQIASSCDSKTLESLAYTLTTCRSLLKSRQVLLAESGQDGGTDLVNVEINDVSSGPLPFVFVFSGQGAQYSGMGKELLARNESFLAGIRELDRTLQALPKDRVPSWSIEQSILNPGDTSQTQKAIHSQTLCTALQIAIVDLLKSWNVKPMAVVGHSSGEIAAAYAAGLMSNTQAILVAYFRGYAVDQVKSTGSMMAVGLDVQTAHDLIRKNDLDQSVCIACVNAPESVTLSGSTEGIRALERQLRKQQTFCRVLSTDGRAYHSNMMKDASKLYEDMLSPLFEHQSVPSRHAAAQMYSSVGNYGDTPKNPDTSTDWAQYWRENLEKPVQFDLALRSVTASKDLQFIEIGPHTTLKGPVNQIRTSMERGTDRFRYAPSLIRGRDADLCMKQLAGILFMHGYSLNWQHVNSVRMSNRSPLHNIPPYPWDYENTKLLYHESRSSHELRNRKHMRHELLGSQQPTGNGIDCSWRNDRLRLKEMPWLRDHKVGGQIVFPAAGYLAMVMEGLSQIRDDEALSQPVVPAFDFCDVNFNAALVIDDEDSLLTADTELHTVISPRKISTTSISSSWYDFSISSWKTGKSRLHCVGSVRETNDMVPDRSTTIHQADRLERIPTDRWYEKFALEGLGFGKSFHSVPFIEVNGSRDRYEAVAITKFITHPTEGHGTYYPMHPITIDACLQAGIMSTCAGIISQLQGYLPVFIKGCLIKTVPRSSRLDSEATIHVRSCRTGVSTQRIHCTLRDAAGKTMIEMGDVRMSLYVGKIGNDTSKTEEGMDSQRHPCLRVQWKPDAHLLQPGLRSNLSKYIASFLQHQDPDLTEDEDIATIGALLDLAGHKNPQMRILQLGESCSCKTKRWDSFLDKTTHFPRYLSWHTATMTADGTLLLDGVDKGPFDSIIVTGRSNSEKFWKSCSTSIISSLADDGIIITHKTATAQSALEAADFWATEVDSKSLLCRRIPRMCSLGNKAVVIVVDNPSGTILEFASFLAEQLRQAGTMRVQVIPICHISEITSFEDSVCISLIEIEHPFLARIRQADLDLLRCITNVATQLLWVTGAGMLSPKGLKPDLTLSSGLSRALMLEQPSLRFVVVDVGTEAFESSTKEHTCNNIIAALNHAGRIDDKEYVQLHGILYVSRFSPDSNLNSLFQRRLQPADRKEMCTLGTAKPARLSIGKVGITDTIHFQQLREPQTDPPAGFVDIEMQVMSLNAKDVYALNGRVETQKGTIAMEFGGVVIAKGPDVPDTQLNIGDRVVAVSPNHFTTTVRVPAWAAQRIKPDEDLSIMSGLPIAYSTALYALDDRAHLRRGESILIHSGTGALGIATITLAQRMGAIVYTTVSSPAKKTWIIENLGVAPANIFHSREAASFVVGVREATQGRGVDVIINSLTGDLMHASWDCIAEFGRFIEVGKRELVDAGKLDMAVFLRNATFTAFDLSELFFHREKYYRDLLVGKMREVLALFRLGEIKPMPTRKFDVADVSDAYRYFSTKDRIGKVVISLENQESPIPVSPAPCLTVLNPDKVYLLIGCLGGLGRSLSRWFLSRGARNFVFLGRSGGDKPAAKNLIAQLREGGATVFAVRGDVCETHDVARAVKCCVDTGRPLGGVVQASMGLSESLFSLMTSDAWQKAIQPKWTGTWNTHSSIRGIDNHLDFFLLLSSISGTVGTATESNYCAANGFLDAFARKCRVDGMPAVSLGLGMVSEVGYLHENPEIEALLLRRGIQPLTEEEFLQMVDFALLSAKDSVVNTSLDSPLAHLLTGLEPLRLRQLKSQGFDISHNTAQDPRASILSAALEADREHDDNILDETQTWVTAPWLKDVPSNALATLRQQADAPSLEAAVLRLSKKCFGNLILLAPDQIDEHKPLNAYGVDSMIASEFRTWFWSAFKVDVPFLDILSQEKSLLALSTFIKAKLIQS